MKGGKSDSLKKKGAESSPKKGQKGKDDDYVIDEEGEEEEEYEDEEEYEEEYEDEQAEEDGDDLKKEKFQQLGHGKKEKDKEDSLDRLVAAAGNLKGKI